ncbi:uncharacterized protein LOC128865741 [Anastrepha ludens]|uniref:uncharacterized protein LOC128865741 n=1 Tax=Anastrepha ludens TaxID=28586 RepID=UPI0023B009DC|nr:uncharacterized protein LOC128865741 [Anastrepha ludens]
MGWFSVSSFLAFLELAVSFAALITKKLTDNQGEQVYKRNQKLSSEWSLLNNLNWSQAGNDFSMLTYGGYTLIAGAFLLSRLNGNKYGTCEKILLICGLIFFFTEAGLVFGTLEYIPIDIQSNALILGTLSAAGAILFFIDICYTTSLTQSVSKVVQTEIQYSFLKDEPSVLHKSSIHSLPLVPASVQIYPTDDRVYLQPQSEKTKGCWEKKNSMRKYLKTRVLQTDV